MDRAERSALFTRRTFYQALIDWAMRDEQFKVQLFRFVDVLPSLGSSAAITSHFQSL
jgi:RHH-type transcriptional regulator, proline utilization regulon repressor / proline dehydrogenase / delta 1-pyrroline-5-carboxylate dehydrogenase